MPILTSFIVVGAEWTCKQALQALRRPISHAVVHRRDLDLVYAFQRDELVRELGKDACARVMEALGLEARASTPTFHEDGAPPRGFAVIVGHGRIAGLHVPPRPTGLESFEPIGLDAVHLDARDPGYEVAVPRDFSAAIASQIQLGKTVRLLVTIGAVGAQVAGAARIAAKRGASVDLVVEATGAIAVDEPSEVSISIDRDDEISTRFNVKALAIGVGRIVVRAFEGPRQIAIVTASVDVVEGAPAVQTVVERQARITPVENPPDLEIEITEDRDARGYRFTLRGGAGVGFERMSFGPVDLGPDVDTFFTDFYNETQNLVRSALGARERKTRLATSCAYLFQKVMPVRDLREKLWAIRDRVHTVRIQSDEPWIPWELCRLVGREGDGPVVEDQFIAQKYFVTRWFRGVDPVLSLTITDAGLVLPPDSGLGAAQAEKEMLEALGCRVTEIKSRWLDLHDELAAGRYDVLHFVGHGAYTPGDPDRSALELEEKQRFHPRDLSGEAENFGRRKPLVFLNACEVGRSGKTLGSFAGWPNAFIRNGASAFIGPLWRTTDATASEFSSAVYTALKEGTPLGKAVQGARVAAWAADDPTWLAFTVYGHPDAKLAAPEG